jgi:hypothetical protein
MSKKLFIGLAVFSYVVVAIGVYSIIRAQFPEFPPCGITVNNWFQNCQFPIGSALGLCDGRIHCQPHYQCFPQATWCRKNPQEFELYPKVKTERRWELGTCVSDFYTAYACSVCPEPCRYVCAWVRPAKDELRSDGWVAACGDQCPNLVVYYGPAGACY